MTRKKEREFGKKEGKKEITYRYSGNLYYM